MNKGKLIEILSIQSESYNQWRMFAYLIRQCKAQNLDFFVEGGNIYITKGYADLYPCIVAHMDTVHCIVEDLTVLEVNGNLTGFNPVMMEQTGIGGDDKVGIFVALQCLSKYDNIKVAFFVDEEVGCVGSYNANIEFFNDCSFVLQCDRRGNKDFIVNASGVELSSLEFQNDVLPLLSQHNYSFNNGMMTDVMALKEIGVQCSVANISCGYYNPHCTNEYVNIADVENCLDLVYAIVDNIHGDYSHIGKEQNTRYFDSNYSIYQDRADIFDDNLYCKDCWSKTPVKDGLCDECLQWYKQEELFF